MGERIMVSDKPNMARSLAIFRLGTFTRLMGPIRVPQLAVLPSYKGIIHRRQTDTATSGSSKKKKSVQCAAMIARKFRCKNAHVDCHAVSPPEYQAGGDSKREDVCQQVSERVTRMGNWKRLEDQALGDGLLQKIFQVKKSSSSKY